MNVVDVIGQTRGFAIFILDILLELNHEKTVAPKTSISTVSPSHINVSFVVVRMGNGLTSILIVSVFSHPLFKVPVSIYVIELFGLANGSETLGSLNEVDGDQE